MHAPRVDLQQRIETREVGLPELLTTRSIAMNPVMNLLQTDTMVGRHGELVEIPSIDESSVLKPT